MCTPCLPACSTLFCNLSAYYSCIAFIRICMSSDLQILHLHTFSNLIRQNPWNIDIKKTSDWEIYLTLNQGLGLKDLSAMNIYVKVYKFVFTITVHLLYTALIWIQLHIFKSVQLVNPEALITQLQIAEHIHKSQRPFTDVIIHLPIWLLKHWFRYSRSYFHIVFQQ